MEKKKIYLDDVRIPVDQSWIVVKNYDEFVQKVNEIGLENIELIQLNGFDKRLYPMLQQGFYQPQNLLYQRQACQKLICQHLPEGFSHPEIDLPQKLQ